MQLSEIGVIFLMFIAGLETDIDALKKQGKACFVIAVLGVLIPFILGLGTTYLFGKFGMQDIMGDSNLFEADYERYCQLCEYKDLEEFKDPCNECLCNSVMEGTRKPMHFKEAKNE